MIIFVELEQICSTFMINSSLINSTRRWQAERFAKQHPSVLARSHMTEQRVSPDLHACEMRVPIKSPEIHVIPAPKSAVLTRAGMTRRAMSDDQGRLGVAVQVVVIPPVEAVLWTEVFADGTDEVWQHLVTPFLIARDPRTKSPAFVSTVGRVIAVLVRLLCLVCGVGHAQERRADNLRSHDDRASVVDRSVIVLHLGSPGASRTARR
jgi:hypothetical protein